MMDEMRIGWMLLRDGHAVPIAGLAPDQLKRSAHSTIEREGLPLRHQRRLNAIVDCLGFEGDFGDYTQRHWPEVKKLMSLHGLRDYRDLFVAGVNDLCFGLARRRELADRLTVSPGRRPQRVFLGGGHPWEAWDRHFPEGPARWSPDDDGFIPEDVEQTRKWVYQRRFMMVPSAHTFLGDQWLDVALGGDPVLREYRLADAGPPSPSEDPRNAAKVVRACRWVLDQSQAGWVDIIPVTERLFLLKGPDGTYDLVWANLRTSPPPPPPRDTRLAPVLHGMDLPSLLQQKENFSAWNYYRLDVWEEKEQHEAELAYYANGGRGGVEYAGLDNILERHLRRQGTFGDKPGPGAPRVAPPGFREIATLGDRRVLVSDLVTIDEVRRMQSLTGYLERRPVGLDRWEPGNGDDLGHLPAAVTWFDAQAFCAWMERQLGCQVRLPKVDEYRAWFPEPTVHGADHRSRRSGVEKLEAWGGIAGQPERVRFVPSLSWTMAPSGVSAIDAINVLEWVQHNTEVAVNPFGNYSCAPTSWGAYKGVKVLFRLVIELEQGR